MGAPRKTSVHIEREWLAEILKKTGLTERELGVRVGHSGSWISNVKRRLTMAQKDKNRLDALALGHQLPAVIPVKRSLKAPPLPPVGPAPIKYLVRAYSEAEAAALRGMLAMAKFEFEEIN